MACILGRCFSPIACGADGRCREINIYRGMPDDAVVAEWLATSGVQPDPRAAGMVADAALLLEQYGDHLLGDL